MKARVEGEGVGVVGIAVAVGVAPERVGTHQDLVRVRHGVTVAIELVGLTPELRADAVDDAVVIQVAEEIVGIRHERIGSDGDLDPIPHAVVVGVAVEPIRLPVVLAGVAELVAVGVSGTNDGGEVTRDRDLVGVRETIAIRVEELIDADVGRAARAQLAVEVDA